MQALGNVNLQAASIVNQGTIASQSANVNAATASLTNSGVIQALAGSVQILNPYGNTLSIDNALGSILARDQILLQTLGSVTDESGNYVSKASLSLSGGTLSANQIHLNSPDGNIAVNTDNINGDVYVGGGTAVVGTQNGDLNIVSMQLTGDPIFYS